MARNIKAQLEKLEKKIFSKSMQTRLAVQRRRLATKRMRVVADEESDQSYSYYEHPELDYPGPDSPGATETNMRGYIDRLLARTFPDYDGVTEEFYQQLAYDVYVEEVHNGSAESALEDIFTQYFRTDEIDLYIDEGLKFLGPKSTEYLISMYKHLKK